jgi:hypothetical protein
MTITGLKTIIITGTYVNILSGAGETGYVEFLPNIPSVEDQTDSIVATMPPIVVGLPGTFGSNNQGGNGHFSQVVPCTDNTELFPAGFTYTIIEKISNLTRVTKGVLIPSTLGSTADITKILAPYLS